MQQNTSVEITHTDAEQLMDCTISIKGLKPNYYLVLEDMLNRFIREHVQPIEGKTHEQMLSYQPEFSLPIEPILQLHDAMLKEVQSKIKPDWKLLSKRTMYEQ